MLITLRKAARNVMIVFDLTDLKHLEKSDCINYIHCWGPCEHRVGLNVYSLNREMVVPLVNLSDVRSDQIRSVAQSCPTLCDPMNRSTPGLPVHHQLLEFTETHVHRVSDAIQPSHPLSSPSPPAPNPSQHQSLFQ